LERNLVEWRESRLVDYSGTRMVEKSDYYWELHSETHWDVLLVGRTGSLSVFSSADWRGPKTVVQLVQWRVS
jgi:hypothetical protein